MRVVVGLGNPGPGYAGTRHNVGAVAVERLARRWGIRLERKNPHALLGVGALHGEEVVLARPRAYMNLSGGPVAYLAHRFGLPLGQLLVICDDLDLPLGTLRLRPGGGPGGHNGLRSIIEALGDDGFPRLRVGIGRPPEGVDPVAYVLGPLTPQEERVLEDVWPRLEAAVECLLAEGISAAMSRYNAPAPSGGDPAGGVGGGPR